MKLNLGCGKDIRNGYVNLDLFKLPGVDKVHDLNKFPYPFKNNAFEEIYCSHVLEHIQDLTKALEELHRISKPGARLIIKAPFFSNPGAFGDPTHKHFFTYNTIDYFSAESGLSYYSNARFKVVKKKINLISTENSLIKLFSSIPDLIINLFPTIYQRFFSYILPAAEVIYIVETVKNHQSKIGSMLWLIITCWWFLSMLRNIPHSYIGLWI